MCGFDECLGAGRLPDVCTSLLLHLAPRKACDRTVRTQALGAPPPPPTRAAPPSHAPMH